MKRERVLLTVSLLFLLAAPRTATGFDNEAHLRFSDRATLASNLDNFLKTQLAFEFPDGINQVFDSKRVTQLIQEGTLREDTIVLWTIVKNHFHNPKLPWDQAGLQPPGSPFQLGHSSVVWSQLQNQNLLGSRSWHQARNAYFTALTSRTEADRKRWWAITFRLLGHAIHHVQDAAAPSHTRNDIHPPVLDPDGFHIWADKNASVIDSITPTSLPASFLENQASADSRYPVPISRLLDVNAGDIGALALGNGEGIGLAEYSNANFFSDDTIHPETFPYPGLVNLESRLELSPLSLKKRRYSYFKPGFGETNYKLAVGSSLDDIVATQVPKDAGLDDRVFSDYAAKLFPRAIGYSAGLIDYFFRGRITHTYTLGTPNFPPNNPPTELTINEVVNATDVEETGNGTITMILTYADQQNTNEIFPAFVISNAMPIQLTRSPQLVTFSFSSPFPFPKTLDSASIYDLAAVIYRGPLGFENDAIIVGDPGCGFEFHYGGIWMDPGPYVWAQSRCD